MLKYLLLFSYLLLTSCFVVESSDDGNSSSSSICLDAAPVTTNAVQVTFRYPKNAQSVEILRNGLTVYSTTNPEATTFIDTPLEEGLTYLYSCRMLDSFGDPITDRNQIPVDTDSLSAPDFLGINSASNDTDTSAIARWLTPGTGVIAQSFRVYFGFSDSPSEVFSKAPIDIIEGPTVRQAVLENLGDGLTYYLGVRACSSAGNCDVNEVLRTVTIPDRGAPQTVGATNIELQNDGNSATVRLTAPWDHTLGEVTTRQIYHAVIAYETACPTQFSSYTAANAVPFNPSTPSIVIQPLVGDIDENETHCFIVRDRDSLGQENQNLNIVKVDVGDITPPDTNPIQLVVNRSVSNPENNLVASWTAIVNETENQLAGADVYRLFVSSAPHPQSPDPDPCTNGTLRAEINASFYNSGETISYTIDNLTARTNYRVCLKVADSSLNTGLVLSKHNILQSTGDITPPVFFGVTSATVNLGNAGLDIGFNLSTSSDVNEYRVRVVKLPSMETFELIRPKPLQASGTYILQATLAELNLSDNDVADIFVNACDNALTLGFNDVNNCSNTVARAPVTIPDTFPPQNFTGVLTAVPGAVDRSILVSWQAPPSWDDYAGFQVSYVNTSGALVNLDSTSCACVGNDCSANPITSCTVNREEGGALLTPSRLYEIYVSAYDITGNQTSQYISFTGSTKITALTRASDLQFPIFNANIEPLVVENGAMKIKFSAATDTQDSSLELRYEIYRKTNEAFICPNTPNISTGGCDDLTPIAVVDQSDLTPETMKLVYLDDTILDGFTYHYQICALDFANNRTCQGGTVPFLNVTDITLPVIANIDSNKQFAPSGPTSWQITFETSDNITPENQLIIRVYRGTSAFPEESNPGIPTFSSTSGTVTVTAGVATFTDTGPANSEVAYYLIEVQDLAGNRTYATARDMTPAPVISNVVMPPPLLADGSPDTVSNQYLGSLREIRIQGNNLLSIQNINETGTEPSRRLCQTSRIISQTDTEIVCALNSLLYYQTDHSLLISDKHGRTNEINNLRFTQYCPYADSLGITQMRGAGTETAPFTICRPEHIPQIGQNVNGTNYVGHFMLGRDIDMSSISNFAGIPEMAAGNFFINGRMNNLQPDNTISNLTIDTTVTNSDAAFVTGCTGTYAGLYEMFRTIRFDNITVRSGSGKAAVLIANKNCLFSNLSQPFVNTVRIENSNIYANNTAGFVAAEYNTNNDIVRAVTVRSSTIHSTRTEGGATYIGGLFGQLTGSSASPVLFSSLRAEGVRFLAAEGQINSGDNIGGLIGRLGLSRLLLENSWLRSGVTLSDRSLISGGGSNIGGLIGFVDSTVSLLEFRNSETSYFDIDDLGSLTKSNRGGIIGYISILPLGAQVLLENVSASQFSLFGFSNIGGYVGRADAPRFLHIFGTSDLTNSSIQGTGNNVGGLVGVFTTNRSANTLRVENATLSHSSSNLIVSGANSVGGIVGAADEGSSVELINTRVFRLNISGQSNIGGFVGYGYRADFNFNRSAVHESNIIGSSNNVGGFAGNIGDNSGFTRLLVVEQCGLGESFVQGVSNVGGLVGTVANFGLVRIVDSFVGIGFTPTSFLVEGQNRVGGLIGLLNYRDDRTSDANIQIQRNAVNGILYAISTVDVGGFIGGYFVPINPVPVVSNNYFRNDYTGVGRITTNTHFSGPSQIEGISAAQAANINTYVGWDINPIGDTSGVWYLDNVNTTYVLKARLSVFSGQNVQYGL